MSIEVNKVKPIIIAPIVIITFLIALLIGKYGVIILILFLYLAFLILTFQSIKAIRISLILYLLVTLFLEFEIFKVKGLIAVNPSRVLLIPILASWLLLVLNHKIKLKRTNSKIGLFLGLFSIAQIILSIFSPTLTRTLFSNIAEIVEYYLVCMIYFTTFRESYLQTKIIKIIAGGMLFACIIGITERILDFSFKSLLFEGKIVHLFDWGYPYNKRVAFTYSHPIAFGTMIGMTIPWVTAFYISKKEYFSKLYYFLILSVLLIALLLTFSRGAWIAALLPFFYMTINRRKILFAYILIILMLVICVPQLTEFFTMVRESGSQIISRQEDTSIMGRYNIVIKRGLKLIKEKPLIGWGMAYNRGEKDFGIFLAGIENYWISIALGKGVIYAFLVILIYLYLWRLFLKKKNNDKENSILYKAYIAFLICFIINITTTGTMGSSANYLWIITGIMLSIRKQESKAR
jgi:O-antigen ligase